MIIGKYDKEKGYDDGVTNIINEIKESLKSNDDFFLLCIGTTGTGKSSLMLHFYEEFDYPECDMKYIGLNRYAHAEALQNAKEKQGLRFCGNDEADISRRDHMTKYNKKMLNLMWQIRGLNIFHWWNNPTADMLDKPLIEERLKGLIFINDKSKDRPRIYYYFTKKAILKIFEKEKDLKHATLIKYKEEAFYKGLFSEYKGKLLDNYIIEKEKKMSSAVDDFATFMKGEREKIIELQKPEVVHEDEIEQPKELNFKVKEKYYTIKELSQYFGFKNTATFSTKFNDTLKRHLEYDKDYFRTSGNSGKYLIYDHSIPIMEKILRQQL